MTSQKRDYLNVLGIAAKYLVNVVVTLSSLKSSFGTLCKGSNSSLKFLLVEFQDMSRVYSQYLQAEFKLNFWVSLYRA